MDSSQEEKRINLCGPRLNARKKSRDNTTGPIVFQEEQEKTRAQPCMLRGGKGWKKRINSAGANDCLDLVGKEGGRHLGSAASICVVEEKEDGQLRD